MAKKVGKPVTHELLSNTEWQAFFLQALDRDLDEWLNIHQGMYTDSQSWASMKEVAEGKSVLKGDLVEDFISMLMARFFGEHIRVAVEANHANSEDARTAGELSQLCRTLIAGMRLKEELQKAFAMAAWAPYGWLELCHPADRFYYHTIESRESGSYEDGYTEIDPQDIMAEGLDLSQVRLAGEGITILNETSHYDATMGYTELTAVDPRLVFWGPVSKDASFEAAEYVARIRFLTAEEVSLRYRDEEGKPYSVPENWVLSGRGMAIYDELYGSLNRLRYKKLLMVIEVHLFVDRNNPRVQDQMLHLIHGYSDGVMFYYGNPVPRLPRLYPVSMSAEPSPASKTLARRLFPYGAMYDLSLSNLESDVKLAGVTKLLYTPGLGMAHQEVSDLMNPESSKSFSVSDTNSVRWFSYDVRESVIKSLLFLKSMAQATTKTSALDQGQAIKEITARQTEVLVDATKINMSSVLSSLQRTVAKILMASMYAMRWYRLDVPQDTQRDPLGKLAIYLAEAGRISMYGFEVNLRAPYGDATEAQQLMGMQLLRMIREMASVPQLAPLFAGIDLSELVSQIILQVTGGQGTAILKPSSDALQASLVKPLDTQGGAGNSMVDSPGASAGQHPERLLGSRGMDVANALAGASRIGTGQE